MTKEQPPVPDLPPLYFVKAGRYTYARTYTAVWQDKADKSKKQAVKAQTKRVGRIDSSSGIGAVIFDPSFIESYPALADFIVTREPDASAPPEHPRYKLVYAPKNPQQQVRPPLTIKYQSIGAALVLDHLMAGDPLLTVLERHFPEAFKEMLSFAYYLVICPEGTAERFCQFASITKLPSAGPLQPHHLTRLFQHISEEDVLSFFQDYLKLLTVSGKISNKRFWAVDAAGSTYAQLNAARCGRTQQGELLPQLNVMLITDELTGRPLYYQIFNGAYPSLTACLKAFAGLYGNGTPSFAVAADCGFFSRCSLQQLVKQGYNFLMCVPGRQAASFQKYLDRARAAMAAELHYDEINQLDRYTCSEQAELGGGDKAWVHVFHNPAAAAEEADDYKTRLKIVINLVKTKQDLTPETADFLHKNFLTDERGELKLDEHGAPVLNTAVYQAALHSCGVFMVLSDAVKHADLALDAYRRREVIAENFASLKARLQLSREHEGAEAFLNSKCFLQFIALTIYFKLEARLRAAERDERSGRIDALPHHSVASCLDELSGIAQYYVPSRHLVVVDQLSKAQRRILAIFGVEPPKTHYEEEASSAEVGEAAPKLHGDDLRWSRLDTAD